MVYDENMTSIGIKASGDQSESLNCSKRDLQLDTLTKRLISSSFSRVRPVRVKQRMVGKRRKEGKKNKIL